MSAREQIPDGWTVGVITVSGSKGAHPVAGWVKAPFGIDYRLNDDGFDETTPVWAITHLATGYAAGAFTGAATDVMRLADKMAEVGAWDFTDVADMAVSKSEMAAVWDEYDGKRFSGADAAWGQFA